jgi:hypothetical protein
VPRFAETQFFSTPPHIPQKDRVERSTYGKRAAGMQFKNAFRLKEKNEKECTIADRQRWLYYHGHARKRWHPRGSLFPEGKAEPVVHSFSFFSFRRNAFLNCMPAARLP